MKTKMRIAALLMSAVMVITMSVPVFAGQKVEKEAFNYVALGASNSNGYGLHGYLKEENYNYDNPPVDLNNVTGEITGYLRAPEGCYPDLVQKSLQVMMPNKNVVLQQLGMSSMRSEDLRVLLDDDYYGDSFTEWRFLHKDNNEGWFQSADSGIGLEKLRTNYQNMIADADFITYDMGANNFGVYLANRLIGGYYDADFRNIYGDEYVEYFYKVRDKINDMIVNLAGDEITKDEVVKIESYADTLAYALLGFCANFDENIKAIRELNPDATIVVVRIQNVLCGLNLDFNGVTIPAGDLLGALINIANLYTASLSPYCNEYYYANIENGKVTDFLEQVEKYSDENNAALSDQDILDFINVYGEELQITKLLNNYLVSTYPGYNIEQIKTQLGENYDALRGVAYDCILKIIAKAASFKTLPISEDFNYEKDSTAFKNDTMSVLLSAVGAAVSRTEYDLDAAIDNLFSKDNNKLAGAFAVRISLGNSFCAHPNREGHVELKNAVMKAYLYKTSGKQAVAYEIMKAIAGIPQNDLNKIESFIKAFSGKMITEESEISHIHKGTYNGGILATCMENGRNSFWTCECGEKFYDVFCTKKVENEEDLVIAKLGHRLSKVSARNAGLFWPGNKEYYICLYCHKLFLDAEGTQPTTLSEVTIYRTRF